MSAPLNGIQLIAAERTRQIEDEKYSSRHDDQHNRGEMVGAAIQYASLVYTATSDPNHKLSTLPVPMFWPWEEKTWRPSDDIVRNLVKAGALIAAEIDRLQRAKAKETKS